MAQPLRRLSLAGGWGPASASNERTMSMVVGWHLWSATLRGSCRLCAVDPCSGRGWDLRATAWKVPFRARSTLPLKVLVNFCCANRRAVGDHLSSSAGRPMLTNPVFGEMSAWCAVIATNRLVYSRSVCIPCSSPPLP